MPKWQMPNRRAADEPKQRLRLPADAGPTLIGAKIESPALPALLRRVPGRGQRNGGVF